MYLAVDIGGTKTLLACFDSDGKVLKDVRFTTAQDYRQFLKDLETHVPELSIDNYKAACVAVPGRLAREYGRIIALGNLPWKNVSIQSDVENIIKAPVVIENDAKLAGLSEALLIKNEFKRVLYVTISTGIGISVITDGIINSDFIDSEGGHILLEHGGKLQKWESFASGKAIVKKYGKRAEDITDKKAWKTIARNTAVGLQSLIVIIQPEVVVIGGGVGQYLDRFYSYLLEDLKKFENPLAPIPFIREAKRPEEAVIYGCYELVKQKFGANHSHKAKS